MNTYLECIPCFMRQALDAAKLCTDNKEIQKEVLNKVAEMIPSIELEHSPPYTARYIYSIIADITGNENPFLDIKKKYNKIALEKHSDLLDIVNKSESPLLTAIRVAIAGNIIDFGTGLNFDLDKEIDKALHFDFGICDFEEFKTLLENSKKILYLADNCGEIVFDKILIERLNKDVTVAVRGIPIINDATLDDALECGVDQVARVISNGGYAPGTILDLCSDEFLEEYNEADMIISKGQGNYESLSDSSKHIFYLLRAKCPITSRDLGCSVGDIICKYNQK